MKPKYGNSAELVSSAPCVNLSRCAYPVVQPYSAKPHTADVLMDNLHAVFGHPVISRVSPECQNYGYFWPTISPDLILSNYFLQDSCKTQILTQCITEFSLCQVPLISLGQRSP
jgi:hypothetical protein